MNTGKVKVLICSLSSPENTLRKSLNVSRDMSQHDQALLSNISDTISDTNLEETHQFENQLQSKYKQYYISLKKDLIHSMLSKSNGITFNF